MTPHPAVLARRRRIQAIRVRVAALVTALFIACFGGLYVQMASGNDPALSASSAEVASTTTTTSTSDDSSTASTDSSSTDSSSTDSSADDSSAMTTQAS